MIESSSPKCSRLGSLWEICTDVSTCPMVLTVHLFPLLSRLGRVRWMLGVDCWGVLQINLSGAWGSSVKSSESLLEVETILWKSLFSVIVGLLLHWMFLWYGRCIGSIDTLPLSSILFPLVLIGGGLGMRSSWQMQLLTSCRILSGLLPLSLRPSKVNTILSTTLGHLLSRTLSRRMFPSSVFCPSGISSLLMMHRCV